MESSPLLYSKCLSERWKTKNCPTTCPGAMRGVAFGRHSGTLEREHPVWPLPGQQTFGSLTVVSASHRKCSPQVSCFRGHCDLHNPSLGTVFFSKTLNAVSECKSQLNPLGCVYYCTINLPVLKKRKIDGEVTSRWENWPEAAVSDLEIDGNQGSSKGPRSRKPNRWLYFGISWLGPHHRLHSTSPGARLHCKWILTASCPSHHSSGRSV